MKDETWIALAGIAGFVTLILTDHSIAALWLGLGVLALVT
jgi:hypothetical protein